MEATAPEVSTSPRLAPVLPEDFDLDGHLRQADADSHVVRIVARVLGEQGESLLIDTAEGVYAFHSTAIRRLQHLDDGSLYVVDIDPAARCTLHSTVTRLVRTRTGTLPSGSPDEILPAPRWDAVDTGDGG